MPDVVNTALMQGGCGKREQILDAAKRLFIEQGYGSTSMDAIAAVAGVSKATVYAHCDGKQALFAAVTERECRRVTARMEIPGDVDTLALYPALRRIADSFLDAIFAPESLALLRMVIAESGRFPALGRIFYECAPGLTLASVVRYLERMRDRQRIDMQDCHCAAGQFLGALRGDLHLRAALGLPVEREALAGQAEAAVETFVARYAIQGR